MLALALAAALAWDPAQAPSPGASASLSDRLGLEGPLDNDTDLARNAEALAALAAGDTANEKADDESARTVRMEHWRRALAQSSPLDAVALDDRISIGVSRAIHDRLRNGPKAAWRERFEGVAAAALEAAGRNEDALTRVAYEYPHTRSGAVAEVRLFDSAFERGATATARAALRRLEQTLDPTDGVLAAALSKRRAFLPAPAVRPEPALAAFAGEKLALERAIDIGPATLSETDRMLEPGFARSADGRIFVQSGETLVVLGPAPAPALHELARLVGDAGSRATWLPSFGDRDRAWMQRPAIDGSHAALVLGRAREARGNALAVFDVSAGPPRLAWIHHDGESPEEAPLPGRLEYQPGPVASAGLVVAQVLRFEQEETPPAAQRVDGRNTHAWLVAFDILDGSVVWKRRLASGADRRGRALDRFDNPRSTSVATLALARRGDDEVVACTELGVQARVSFLDGRLIESYALKRVRHDPDIRPGSGGPFVSGDGSLCAAPADADEFVYLQDAGARAAVRVPPLDRLIGKRDQDILALVEEDGRSVLARIDGRDGRRTASLPLPRGAEWKGGLVRDARIVVAAGGSLLLYSTDARLLATLDLAGLENERHVGVWEHAAQVYVAGEGRIWAVRVE